MDSTQVMKLSSVGYLRLAYVATEITLHRRIILALSPSTDPQLLRICRSVAHERFMFAIAFVQSLKTQHVSSFWYFASAQNFALIGVFGTLLLSTASNTEEADFYKTKLKEYRWILKMNSENGARYMKPAMTLLDANMALLTEANTPMPSVSNSTLGYTKTENGSIAGASGHSDEYSFSNAHLSTSGDFTSPSQYSFDTPYYPNQHSADGSTATFSPLTDAQFQEFGASIGSDSGPWSY
jgi:hypothetical protein